MPKGGWFQLRADSGKTALALHISTVVTVHRNVFILIEIFAAHGTSHAQVDHGRLIETVALILNVETGIDRIHGTMTGIANLIARIHGM